MEEVSDAEENARLTLDYLIYWKMEAGCVNDI